MKVSINILFWILTIQAKTESEIISTAYETISYVNDTAKLSCIIKNKDRQHVSQIQCVNIYVFMK